MLYTLRHHAILKNGSLSPPQLAPPLPTYLVLKGLQHKLDADVHVDDERMPDGRQNFLLVLDVVDLLQFQHLGDGQHLECEVLLAWRVLYKNDAPECSRPCTQCSNARIFTCNYLALCIGTSKRFLTPSAGIY